MATEVGRPAGPLPSKIGEIGFVERATAREEMREVSLHDDPGPSDTVAATAATPSITVNAPAGGSGASTCSKRSIFSFKQAKFKGILFGTVARIIITLLLLVGAVIAWVVVIQHLDSPDPPNSAPSQQPPAPSGDTTAGATGPIPTTVFVHITFAVGVLFILLFLERGIFQARAERYNFLYPGSGAANSSNAGMGLAPWNRPSLPTYAATLAGRGTGDVEDHIIAQPPPPAYGNTRDSTLLLSNLLRNSLRSITDRRSQVSESGRGRPISYGDSEERTDAERARQVEAALARLEEGAHHH